MKYLRTLGWVSAFLLLVAGFFYQTVLYGKLPVPSDTLVGLYHPWRDRFADAYPRGVPFKNFLITDPVRQQIPWKKTVIDSWKAGVRPGWNPYAFAGVPMDANNQAAPYYPLNILFFLFDFPVAWTLLIIFQPMLAGIFFYMYMKHRNVSPPAAMVGAVAWAFSGFAVSWMTWGTIMHTALWIPLMLLSIDMLIPSKKALPSVIRWGTVLSASCVMMLFGGHMQIALYGLAFAAIYFFRNRKLDMQLTAVRIMLVALVAAGVVASVQWVPFVHFLFDSGRISAMDSWKTVGWFLPWQHLIQFVVPDFFGNPATLNYWGVWNYGEFIGYIGIIPLILALSAVGSGGMGVFFSAAAGISLMLMLPNPLSGIPYMLHIPFLSSLQPTRLMVIVDFSLAVLAALGLDRLLKGDWKRLRVSFFVFGVVFTVLWIVVLGLRYFTDDALRLASYDIARRNMMLPTATYIAGLLWFSAYRMMKHAAARYTLTAIVVSVIVFDLFRFGWKFTPFTPSEYFFPETQITMFLQNQKKPFRVMSVDDRILPPNVSGYYGIETIEGYDPIAPILYEDLLVSGERGSADISRPTGFNRIYTTHNIDSVILPYLNVRYVLALADIDRPFLRLIMKEGQTRLYEYERALPRVYVADTTIVAHEPQEALSALFSGKGGRLGIYDGNIPIMNVGTVADETVEIMHYSPGIIRLKTQTKTKRLVVILNRYDSRWKAVIDGESVARLFPVNYLFTGMAVSSGTHEIVLSYH